jgi:Holliday junction resolvase RusA-like endonuclease
MIELILEGKPIAKKRPRFARIGKGIKTYDIQREDKSKLRMNIRHQLFDKRLFEKFTKPLKLEMVFESSPADSWSEKKKQAVYEKYDPRKPDIDNYVKMYLDVMNNLVYKDDNQVVELWCKKIFSDKPKVIILISEIDGS